MSDPHGIHLTPEMTTQQVADELAKTHEEYFRRLPMGELRNSILLEGADGHYELIGCPWSGPDERYVVIESLRVLVNTMDIVRYAFFAEVWLSTSPDPNTRPSLDPNREEIVFTVVCDRRLPEPVLIQQQMIRGRSGGVRKLVRKPDASDLIGGVLVNLFDRKGPLQ